MKITLNFEKHYALVEKENGDPYFHPGGWADAESTFLYHVKNTLRKMGYNVIKIRMWKDGHLVTEQQQYVRTKKYMKTPDNTPNEFAVYNSGYMTEDAGLKFNSDGKIYLNLVQ